MNCLDHNKKYTIDDLKKCLDIDKNLFDPFEMM